MKQDIINESNNLYDAHNRIRDIVTKLLTSLDESEDLFRKNTNRSYIIGYLQGYIRSEMQELSSIREEIRRINVEIQQLIEPLND